MAKGVFFRDGRWHVRFRYRDRDGIRRYLRRSTGPGTTEQEAIALRNRWKREADELGLIPVFEKTEQEVEEKPALFSAFARKFIDDYAEPRNKPSEVDNKKRIIKNHLYPFFGHRPLKSVRRWDVEQYVAAKVAQGLSPKTVNNHLACLRRIFNVAVELEVLESNPMTGVKKLRLPDADFAFYDRDETNRFLAECRRSEPRWHPFFATAFMTGMRLGELAGLKWRCVDLERGLIHVRRSVWRGKEGAPKGGRSRSIPMDRSLADVLAEHRGRAGADDHVFLANSGEPLTENSHRKTFARIIERAGLKRIRFHDVRHSFASQLVIRGEPIVHVQKLLGHASVQMTERYAHLAPEATRESVKALAAGLVLDDGSPDTVVVPFKSKKRIS